MGLFNNFPYMDLSNLNLDFILKKLKDLTNYAESAESSATRAENAKTIAVTAQNAAESAARSAESSARDAQSAETSAENYAAHIADPVGGLVTTWLDDNITPTTPPVDASLTIQGAAADAKATGDAITNLNSQLVNSVPIEVKRAMDTMFANMAAANNNAYASEYATIHAWASSVTVTSINAVFNQGANIIFTIDTLDTLKQYLTVTANYSDGTSGTVSTYELSGTLTAGESTIIVTYSGVSSSFTVNVTAGVDVAPALSGFVAGSGTQITYNVSDDSLNVKTTTNSTYLAAGAGSDLTFRTGYTYRLIFDVVAVSGTANHMLAFRNSSSNIVTETRTEFASVGTYQKDTVLSDCARLEGQTTCKLFVFAAANDSGNGDVTIKNLKLIEYMAGA